MVIDDDNERSPETGRGERRLPAVVQNLEGRGQQGFEGPEKTVEIEFDPKIGHEDGLRAIRREQWDAILEQARAVTAFFHARTRTSRRVVITYRELLELFVVGVARLGLASASVSLAAVSS